MAMIADRPPTAAPQDPTPESPRTEHPNWLKRYQQHLWIGGVSLLLIGAFSVPIALAPGAETGGRGFGKSADEYFDHGLGIHVQPDQPPGSGRAEGDVYTQERWRSRA